jgi:hypothetical protein
MTTENVSNNHYRQQFLGEGREENQIEEDGEWEKFDDGRKIVEADFNTSGDQIEDHGEWEKFDDRRGIDEADFNASGDSRSVLQQNMYQQYLSTQQIANQQKNNVPYSTVASYPSFSEERPPSQKFVQTVKSTPSVLEIGSRYKSTSKLNSTAVRKSIKESKSLSAMVPEYEICQSKPSCLVSG